MLELTKASAVKTLTNPLACLFAPLAAHAQTVLTFGAPVAGKKTLSLGCIVPLSGPAAATGRAIADGARMAIQERATKELGSGVAVVLTCVDSRCDAPGAAAAAKKLTDMGVRK